MLMLPPNLASLAKLAAKDDTRFTMTAVELAEFADGYRVTATDGRRVAIVEGPGGGLAPMVPAMNDAVAAGLEDKALVPAADFARLLKSASKLKRPAESFAYVALSKHAAHFSVGPALEQVPVVDGRFPNWRDLKVGSVFTVKVSARLLAELLLVAAEFGLDGGDAVTLHFGRSESPFAITTENAEQRFQSLIMPLT